MSWPSRIRDRIGAGSKRDALILVPASLIPSAASFLGLILVIRFAGVKVGGLLSLCRVTATFGGALLAEGPALSGLRMLTGAGADRMSSFRGALLLRSSFLTPLVALIGIALRLAGSRVGTAIICAAPLVTLEALTAFEADTLRFRQNFARSSALSSLQPLAAWTGAVIGATVWGSFLGVALPFMAGELLVVLVLGSVRVARATRETRSELASTWGPVARANIAGYALNNGDQYVVDAFLGPAAVGTYALGYQLGGGAVGLLTTAIAGAMGPRIVREWNEPGTGPEKAIASSKRTALAILGTSLAVIPGLLLIKVVGLADVIVRSNSLIPVACIVAVATGVHTVASVAYSPLLLASGRTRDISRCSWITLLVAAAVVPSFTALWGLIGTALATLVAYVLMAALLHLSAMKIPEGPLV